MGCYGDAAKGAFDTFFTLEIRKIHFLGALKFLQSNQKEGR